ncbi:MAG: phosphotransferase family protein [Anaerolineae bacterium]
MDLERLVREAVAVHLPGRRVAAVEDRGEWVRRIVLVRLEDGEDVVFKISRPHEGEGWLEGGERIEQQVAQLLAPTGLHVVPPVLAVDSTCEIMPTPYVIQACVGGTRLGQLLRDHPEMGADIYGAIGRVYAGIHSVQNDRDGLWNGSTPDKPWGTPTVYMYQAEIVGGSGRRAVESGRITQQDHDRAVALWGAHLDYLNRHQPTMVHVSAFPWTIYLEPDGVEWRVVKLTSVGDFLWWDPAYDVACLWRPPFGEMRPDWWDGFLNGYGEAPERKRLLLYVVMQRLCAAMGAYMAPQTPENARWAEHALVDFGALLDEVEAAS